MDYRPIHLEQGKLLARAKGLGFELGQEAGADILIEEVIKTSEIEGAYLNRDLVRSSVAKHLGLPSFGLPQRGSCRYSDRRYKKI
jgi:hypothetical protein